MLTTCYIDSGAPEGSEVSIGSYSAQVHYSNDGTSKSDYRDINDTINTNLSLDSYLVDSTETTKSNITVNFFFTDGTNYYRVPEYADAFLGGYYTDGVYNNDAEVHGTWTSPDEESTKLTENTSDGKTYYSITLSELYAGDVTFQIYLEYKDEETGTFSDWDNKMWDINYTISKYLANNSTIDITVNQDPNDFITEPVYGSETEFYVFAFDYSNDSWSAGLMSSVEANVACFDGSATASGTDAVGTGTLGGNSSTDPYNQVYVYTKAAAKCDSGTMVSFTFSGSSGGTTYKISTGSITVPEVGKGNIAIYFCAYESSNFWSEPRTASTWTGVNGGVPSTYKPDSNGWVTNCSSLEAFIQDLATITTMVH